MSTPNFEPKMACTQRVDFAQLFLQRFELRFERASFRSQPNKLPPNGDESLVKRQELIAEYR
jgi:hypothetical protein